MHCGPYTETKGDDASHEDTVCAALRGFGYPFRCVGGRAIAEDSLHPEL